MGNDKNAATFYRRPSADWVRLPINLNNGCTVSTARMGDRLRLRAAGQGHPSARANIWTRTTEHRWCSSDQLVARLACRGGAGGFAFGARPTMAARRHRPDQVVARCCAARSVLPPPRLPRRRARGVSSLCSSRRSPARSFSIYLTACDWCITQLTKPFLLRLDIPVRLLQKGGLLNDRTLIRWIKTWNYPHLSLL